MNDVLLPLLLALPLAGALALLLLPGSSGERVAVPFGVAVSGLTFAASVWAVAASPETDVEWVPDLGLRFHLGLDGLSAPLVLLTTLLVLLCSIYLLRIRPEAQRMRALIGLLLLLEVGMLGTFVALDMLLFFVFF